MAKTLASAITKAASPSAAPVHSGSGGWRSIIKESFAGAWQRNQALSQEDVLSSPIVYACVTRISNDFGKLRARKVVCDKDGIWTEDQSANAINRLLRRPNRYQNQVQFKQWWQTSKLTKGNAYGLKQLNAKGEIESIYILNPDMVTPLVSDDGTVFYQLGQDNLAGLQQGVIAPAEAIIHDRMNCLYHPLVGVAPLYAAAIAAGIGVKIQNNTMQFFANSATPSGILIAPGTISPENAASIKEQWQSGYSGANAGKVAVLGEGMKFEPMAQTASDSQLIETLRWTDERICSVFHVPGYKVGVGETPAYNNIEALDRAYYSDCLQSPIEEFEAVMDDGMGFDGIKQGIEVDIDGLMRMDSKTLMETLSEGVKGRILAPNNARKRVNLPPLKGGDTVYMQQQDYPLEQVRLNRIDQGTTTPAPLPPVAPPPQEDKGLTPEQVAYLADRIRKANAHEHKTT